MGGIVNAGTVVWAAPYTPPTGIGAPDRRESAGTRDCVLGNPAHLDGQTRWLERLNPLV